MKNRNKIVAFLLAGVLAAGHGSVVYADVSWDLCAVNKKNIRTVQKIMEMQTLKSMKYHRPHRNMPTLVLRPC